MIKVSGVNKKYGEVSVLKDINLELETLGQYAVLGSSGSGKSTLLYLMGALETVSSGVIEIGGTPINKFKEEDLAKFRNLNIGFVFQFHFLLPSMNCEDNILLPVKISGKPISDYKKLAKNLAKYLGVDHCLKKYPYQISGGEQQRINLIRALILKPKLLLCDEPTGNLDSVNSQKVIGLLRELSSEFQSTLVVVTHDQNIASQFADKITIEDGQLIS